MVRKTVNTESIRVTKKGEKYFLDFGIGIEVDPELIVNGVIPNNTLVEMTFKHIKPVKSETKEYDGLLIVLETEQEPYEVKTKNEQGEIEGIIIPKHPSIEDMNSSVQYFIILLPKCTNFTVETLTCEKWVYEIVDGKIQLLKSFEEDIDEEEYEEEYEDDIEEESYSLLKEMEKLATMDINEFVRIVKGTIASLETMDSDKDKI
uniref:Uncharacterized protein n=1 Tax=Fervidobacterium pennivorans TaxID=93466 RepID=A0A7V4KBG8_FERPE